jgi:uncharacterized protein (TIRG00374 family)
MNLSPISILKYVLFLGIAFGLFWLAFRGIDLNQLIITLKNANIVWLIPAFLISIVAHYTRGLRWNMLINSLGFQPLASNSFFAVCIGYLANSAVPRLGEITRCTILNRTDKVPMDALIGTVVVERVIDVITVFAVLFGLIVFRFDVFGGFFIKLLDEKFGNLLAHWPLILVVLTLGIGLVIYFSKYWFNRLKNVAGLNKIMLFMEGIWKGLQTIGKLKNPALFIFYSIFIWAMYLLVTLSAFKCLAPTSQLGLTEGLAVLVAGGFGMAAPTPGGLGSYHILVTEALMLFGVPRGDGLAAATLNHLSQTVMLIIFGGFSLLMVFFRSKPKA